VAGLGFCLALATCLLVSLRSSVARRGPSKVWAALAGRRVPRVFLAVGPLGVLGVLAQGTWVGTLGVALFSLFFIGGQLVSGAVMDHVGWRTNRRRFGVRRLVAVVVAITGIGLAVVPRLDVAEPRAVLAAGALVLAVG